MDKFDYLYKRYLDQTASEEERTEFFALVRTGRYDHKIKRQMLKTIKREMEIKGSPDEIAVTNRILKRVDIPQPQNKSTPVVPIRRDRNYWWITAAAIVLIATMTALWINTQWQPKDRNVQQETFVPESFTGKQFIKLPDESTVLLNENSKLTYEDSFGIQSRKVVLTGEAYFDVRHDPSRPFIVRTGKVKTTVLGTAFNIKAYEEQQEIMVTVDRGKVSVGDDERVYDQILPDEQLAINTITNHIEKKRINSDTAVKWKDQFFVLNNVSLEKAADMIGDRYDVEVSFTNSHIKKCRMTATFLEDETLEQVTEVLSSMIGANFTIENSNIIIEGGKCR